MKGVAVILGGDFNIDIKGLECWAEALNLHNASAECTGGYPTFIINRETQTCIDHVFASGDLMDRGYIGVGIYTESMWNSDHLTIVAEVKYKAFLGLLDTDLQPANERKRRFMS